jgi:hypothetical protein
MVETLIATAVYGILFYVCYLARVFDAGSFSKGNY